MSDQPENVAETVRDIMATAGDVEIISGDHESDITSPFLVSVPKGRNIQDLTTERDHALQFFKPLRRYGKAKMQDLQSLIDWSNRFKNEDSAFYARQDMTAASLTCIADYHAAGPSVADKPCEKARHCSHRADYAFPFSDEWKLWMGISGKWLEKDEMGEFIENCAMDVQNPTPAILGRDHDLAEQWEANMIRIADAIDGRFGQFGTFLQLSKKFAVYESSNLSVTANRDTGEQSITFLNEHKDADGQPIKVPNLIIIAIPVVKNGPKYRVAVRFRYKKRGAGVLFQFSVFQADYVFKDMFDKAVADVKEKTGLPVFFGADEEA